MKHTTTIRIGTAFLILLVLLLVRQIPSYAIKSEAPLSFSVSASAQQQPRDTQGPLVAVITPERGSSHNVFPVISGTAEDKEQTGPTPQQTIPPSGVARVLVVIYSYANGKYWNGAGWIATTDPINFALPARLSGKNWTLDAGLPAGDNLNLGNYSVVVIAFDNADNRGDGYTEVSLSRFFITLWDANAAFADQLDFSDKHEPISDASLARLAVRFHNQFYGNRQAAVADGTTKILVMAEGDTPGALSFQRKFDGIRPIGEDSLTQVNSSALAENIYPIASVGDKYLWLALYTVPDGIEKPSDFFTPRRLEFTAVINGGRKQDASLALWFNLLPPPVLLIHGVWSNAATWGGDGVAGALLRANLRFFIADYSKTAAAHFADNQYVPLSNERDGIAKILTEYRQEGIACTQVDVAGHSMGGLLTRQYMKTPNYRIKHNFNKGYVHRLITIGTPHSGSEVANLLRFLTLVPGYGRAVSYVVGRFLGPAEDGAIQDLQTGSSALAALGQTDVPCYSIVGNADPRALIEEETYGLIYKVSKFVGVKAAGIDVSTINSFYETLFPVRGHDLLVAAESQRGGLSRSFTEMFFPVTHLGETNFEPIGEKVVSLLRSPREAFADSFPAPSPFFSPSALTEALAKLEAEQSARSRNSATTQTPNQTAPIIDIASPSENETFSLLTPVPITLRPLNGANIQAALVMVDQGVLILPTITSGTEPSHIELLEGSQLSAPMLVFPLNSGKIQIKVYARDEQGQIGEATRNIIVRPDGPLLVNPPALELSIGGSEQLQVMAFNLDGTVEDVTSDATGTRYESSDTKVVTVSEKGLVKAIGQGEAKIAIRNGEKQTSVTATVIGKTPLLFEISPDRIEARASGATLTIKGLNLNGVIRVEFLRNGEIDRALTASNSRVETNGSLNTLTVNLQIAANAASGPRTVVVVTQEGASASAPRAGNVLMIEGSEQPPLSAPKIATLDPASKEAGGAQFVMTINGSGFVVASQVMWNGSLRQTVYESATRLRATIPAADIAKSGTANVIVSNPAASGGASNAVTFNILQPNNPIPVLTQFSPNSATAGGATFTLTVTGRQFVNGAKLRWNGTDRSTSFVSSSELKATILASDIASPGTVSVTVFNPLPGGGVSNGVTFTILRPDNPIPAITQLSPGSAKAGSASFTLTVTGRNFVNGAKVRWNGADRATTFVSATELKAAITAADIAAPGAASLTVFNPAPGGGASNALPFTINPSNGGGNAEQEPNETSAQATSLPLPGTRTGAAAVGDAAYWVVSYQDGTQDGLEDFFALTVAQSSIVELKLTAANAAADLDLFLFKEENGSLSYLGYSLAGPGVDERIVTQSALAPGRYLVAVSAFSGSSSYTLTVAVPDSRLLSLGFNNTLAGARGEAPLVSTGVSFGQGVRGAGLSLPAGNQLFYGSAGNINSTEGTMELWIKPNWNGNDSRHHSIMQHGGAGGMLIGKDSANNLRLMMNRYGSAGGVEIDTSFNIADWRANQWYHVAFTWSSSQKAVRIYINGVMKSNRTFNQGLPAINSDRLQIGGDGAGSYLDAVIDEFAVYGVPLSAGQIAGRYQSP